MNKSAIAEAAQIIWQHWSGRTQMTALPEHFAKSVYASGIDLAQILAFPHIEKGVDQKAVAIG